MLWLFMAIVIVGLVAGMFLRVFPVVMLSAIIAVMTLAYGIAAQWALSRTAVDAISLTVTLQLSYMIGLWLGSFCPRDGWCTKSCRHSGCVPLF